MVDRRYAINVAYRAQPFFQEVIGTGRQIGSAVPGVEFVLGGPLDDDSDMQIEELETLIGYQVNGIIVFPADSKSLAPTINKAIAKRIPVVTLFSDVDSNRLTLIGGPEQESAKQMAKRVFGENLDFERRKTKVLVSYNKSGETVTDARFEGIKEIAKSSRYRKTVRLIGPVDDGGDAEKAEKAISKVLTEHGDIKVIFGLNARSAVGAIAALKGTTTKTGVPAYKPGDVIVTGWDNDDDVLDGIEQGWVHSTSVLHTSLCTQIGFGILEAYNLGFLYPEILQLRELSFSAVPREILIPETYVDKTRVDGYRRKRKHDRLAHTNPDVKPARRSI